MLHFLQCVSPDSPGPYFHSPPMAPEASEANGNNEALDGNTEALDGNTEALDGNTEALEGNTDTNNASLGNMQVSNQ